MNSTYAPPPDIRERRAALKRKQRTNLLQSLWRTVFVAVLTGGLVWASLLPQWGLRQPQAVTIKGNQYLTAEAIRQLLVEATAEPIITLSPEKIKTTLQQQAPIAQVSVSRELYPSRLTIAVQESPPVAKTVPHPTTVNPLGKGYLDANGHWMSQESYQSSQALTSDLVKVVGYRPYYRLQWAQIYPKLQAMPLKVKTVNWQNPANLILETELGTVHLGGNLETFSQQLETLAQLKNLSQAIPPSQRRYINLKTPHLVLVEVDPEPNKKE